MITPAKLYLNNKVHECINTNRTLNYHRQDQNSYEKRKI